MKRVILFLSFLSFTNTFLADNFVDLPSLSRAEKTAIWGARIGGALIGAKILAIAGNRYIDQPKIENFELDLNIDLDLDLTLELDLDLDAPIDPQILSGMAGTTFQAPTEEKPQKEEQPKEEELTEEEKKRRDEQMEKKKRKEFILGVLQPGKRVGYLVGALAGYKAGGLLANHVLAWHHGVSLRTEYLCRFFKINIAQYKALIQAIEKKNRKQMLAELEKVYAARFGHDWQKKLHELWYKYDNYPHYIFSMRKKSLKKEYQQAWRMIELAIAFERIYARGERSYKKGIDSARDFYQMMGFKALFQAKKP